ncbi:MAG: prepilin-type N-terminal cleavage/methylation domain-containing protein [Phycisphaerales bacterium]
MRTRSAEGRPGFTLVEMLVTLAIITILMGLLLTGLRAARGTARDGTQLSNVRQLFVAWTLYANQNQDACMPGFMDAQVQATWKLKYKNQSGQNLDPALCQTYTWRLLPFYAYSTDVTLGYMTDVDPDINTTLYTEPIRGYTLPAELSTASTLPGSAAAIAPAFGYNAYYLGGWWTTQSGAPSMAFEDAKDPTGGNGVRVVARTIGAVSRPSDMVAFASSALSDPGTFKGTEELAIGAAWVVPPWLGTQQVWSIGQAVQQTLSVPGQPTSLFAPEPAPVMQAQGDVGAITVYAAQAVPLRRYAQVVECTVDGGAKTTSYAELSDMRFWTNRTDLKNAQRFDPVHTPN